MFVFSIGLLIGLVLGFIAGRRTAKATDEDFIRKWEKMRRRGRLWFVIVWGVLFWGGLMAVTMTFLQLIFGGPEGFHFIVLFNFIGFPIGGIFFGLITYYFNDKKYQKLMRERVTEGMELIL
jgi:hypothetical protein